MLNNFVTQALAKRLRDKGFNKPCFSYFTDVKETKKQNQITTCSVSEICFDFLTKKKVYGGPINYNSEHYRKEGSFSAPTYEQVIDWFRYNAPEYLKEQIETHLKKKL